VLGSGDLKSMRGCATTLFATAVALLAVSCRSNSDSGAVRLKGPDGAEYLLLDRGEYKGFYDRHGRLDRIEYDSNGDGKTDHIARHSGQKSPHTLEVDEDFDGRIDRWEDYDPQGRLVKVGVSRSNRGAPDLWITLGSADVPAKKEYDENGDMHIDRTEFFERGLIVRVELDTDADGKVNRWQDWRTGRLTTEDVDSDGDGRPDRRITYTDKGRVFKLEPIKSE